MKRFISVVLTFLLIIPVFGAPFSVPAGAAETVVWQSVYTGGNTVLAVKNDGTVWGWGINSSGALGDDTTTNRTLPVQTTGASDWKMLSTSGGHSLGIKNDGTLWAWGGNYYGQLGDGTNTDKSAPVQIGSDNDWAAVSAGGSHSLGVKSNGDLYSWGFNYYGELGLGISGNTAHRNTPQLVSSSYDWVYVYARPGNSFAIQSDGSLWGCGENYNYVLGLGDNTGRKSFTRVGTASDWKSVSSKGGHTLAIKTSGELWGWGNNTYGQLGDGTNSRKTNPVRIGSGTDWEEVSAGDNHTVARKTDGTIWAMGWNSEGQLGTGNEDDSNVPVQVGTDSNWLSVKAGANHNQAIKSDGSIWAWGRSDSYQLGLGTKTSRHFPVLITGSTVPITVVSTSPAAGATGVAADAPVSVTFEDWVQDGVNSSSIIMTDSTGDRVNYAYTIAGNTVTFDRRGLLPNNSTYTVSFPAEGMQDVPAFSFSFTTGESPFNFKKYAYHMVGYYPTGLTSGDFNKDGKRDVAAVNELDHNISIALGNGDGTFQNSTNIGYLANSRPSGVVSADVNSDTNPDLVVVRHLNNTVAVFFGNGDGTFLEAVTYTAGSRPLMATAGDFDGDNDIDIAVVNRDSNNISVFLNNGEGTFSNAVNYTTGSYPYWVTAADINADNRPDLITANNSSGNVSVFINNGDGTFQPAISYDVISDPSCVAAGDLNNDNRPDLLVIRESNYVCTLLGNGDGTFQTRVPHAIPANTYPPAGGIADMNGDGNNDLIITTQGNDTVTVILGNGDGTFQDAVSFVIGSPVRILSPHGVLAEDFNGDSKPDLVVTARGYSRLAILINESGGTPDTTPPTWPGGSLTASNVGQTGLTLTWTTAVDNISVAGYRIYKDSNLLATVSGTVYDVTGLTAGTDYTFKVEAGDAAGNWSSTGPSVTVTTAEAPPRGRGGGGGTPDNPAAKVLDSNGNIIKTVTANLNISTGVVTVEVTSGSLTSAFDKSKANDKGITTVKVDIPKIEGAKAFELILPASFLTAGDVSTAVEMKTSIAAVTVPGNMLTAPDIAGAKNISLIIAAGDKSKLDLAVQTQIGDRPVIELNLEADGKQIPWNNESAPVTVTLPYTPTADELKDPEHITVWYIDEPVSVPSGRYDPATGKVTFSTTHYGKYALVFVHKTFADLGNVEWGKKSIEVMASKGIINGTGANTYSPASNITRAEYLVMLVRTLGLTADFDGNFDDVQRGAYYYEAAGIAKKLGIAAGGGNNRFHPTENISRQDMMVLTARALEKYKGLKATTDFTVLDKFRDKAHIAVYAGESLATLVKEGLVVGSGDTINPRAKTTRAEAAAFLYRIYNKYPG